MTIVYIIRDIPIPLEAPLIFNDTLAAHTCSKDNSLQNHMAYRRNVLPGIQGRAAWIAAVDVE